MESPLFPVQFSPTSEKDEPQTVVVPELLPLPHTVVLASMKLLPHTVVEPHTVLTPNGPDAAPCSTLEPQTVVLPRSEVDPQTVVCPVELALLVSATRQYRPNLWSQWAMPHCPGSCGYPGERPRYRDIRRRP
jgi:hypothetical protein